MSAQALVLDFGGVVTRTLFETHPLTERALGLAPGTLGWRGPFDPASDSLWRTAILPRRCKQKKWFLYKPTLP